MENLYLTMNLFGYEKLTPPPKSLPENLTTCYITDDENISNQAKELGWDIVKKTNSFSAYLFPNTDEKITDIESLKVKKEIIEQLTGLKFK